MKKLFIALIIGIGVYGYIQNNPAIVSSSAEQSVQNSTVIADVYQNQLSDIQVSGSGIVNRTLRDDNKGSRHQRFILRLPSGQTLSML